MHTPKTAILHMVEETRQNGPRVGDVLMTVGIKRATYYRWKKRGSHGSSPSSSSSRRVSSVLPEEQHWIDEVKTAHPGYRHRQIQGVLQAAGRYVSASTIYRHLQNGIKWSPIRGGKPRGSTHAMRSATGIWCGGGDWTKLSIGYVRWYLLTVIDFFSRYVIAFAVVPTVTAAQVQAMYRQGLRAQGIPFTAEQKPAFRVDRGSPNTAWVTQAFFHQLEADLSFARVRRPTDNAITERFYGSLKHEEVYVVGNYPDEHSAHEEIGQYIDHYNHDRPHRALMNFTPAYVHQINNKTRVFQERQVLKQAARDRGRAYWLQAPIPLQDGETNEGLGLDQEAIVESRAKMKDD